MHPAEMEIDQLWQSCSMRRQRRSGPGGQHRNKVETAVVLTHQPSGIQAEASERRSQHENRLVAIHRLRVNLALQLRHPRTIDTGPSAGWKSRCRNQRIRVNVSHDDFPALLAEALDVLVACDDDTSEAAACLEISHSQFVRFLKLEPRALQIVNDVRIQKGHHPLR